MKAVFSALIGIGLWVSGAAYGDDRDLALFANPELVEAGLMKFLLPRFSLKTGVKVHVEPIVPGRDVPPGAMVLQTGPGIAVLAGLGKIFVLGRVNRDDPAAKSFADWLLSEIGQRTVAQFAPDGAALFTGAARAGSEVEVVALTGNASRGEALAYDNCGRCHVIGARNRMKGIGSTPSFAVVRSLANWQDRFTGFYALNPHPSFSQIKGVTAPFDKTRPPPISPLRLTQEELDDIVAFAGTVEPADLGARLDHQ